MSPQLDSRATVHGCRSRWKFWPTACILAIAVGSAVVAARPSVLSGGNMRSIRSLATLGLSVLAAACSRQPEHHQIDTRLRQDLALASGLEMAERSYQPVRFVSEIERIPEAPRRRGTMRPSPAPVRAVPDPPPSVDTAAVQLPEVPAAATAAPIEREDVPRIPVVMPRPVPSAGESPGHGTGSNGPGPRDGPDIGTIIGVVIRGGLVGVDRCAPPRRLPPRRIPLFPRR
jgi:hypothetical protein